MSGFFDFDGCRILLPRHSQRLTDLELVEGAARTIGLPPLASPRRRGTPHSVTPEFLEPELQRA
jgi:hypothetical protein